MMSIPDTITTSSSKTDVIIIGAGLSGLTSALKILEKEPSLQVKIIEATNSMGGQIANTKLGEIGGKWINEDQSHVYSLIKELQLPLRRRRILSPDLARCWDIDGTLTSFLVRHELERYTKELDMISQYFRTGQRNPYSLKGTTMCSHINSRLYFCRSRKFMGNIVLLFSGADADDITFNDFMGLCWSCGGLKMLMDLYLELPETLWEISSESILQDLKKKLSKAEIVFRRRIIEIVHYRDGVEVIDSEKETHKAEAVILAIPKNNIETIKISPTVPIELRKPVPPPIERTKYVVTSFQAKYIEGHWRLAGYNGNLMLNEPFFIIGHEYRPTVYAGIIIHEEGVEPLTRQIVLSTLATQYGEEMFLPIEYFERTYQLNPMTELPFTSPWQRLVWSSSATAATCYRGRLNGAVQSGLRAAMNVLFILRPQTVNWQDIAEIQKTSNLISPQATRFSIWLQSWNILNLSSYGIFVFGVTTAAKLLLK